MMQYGKYLLKKTLLPLILGFILSAELSALLEKTRESLPDNGKPIVITGIDIEVKGISNRKILTNRIGIQTGDEFANLTELRGVLDIEFNSLQGTGYFKREDGIRYRLIETGSTDGRRQIVLKAEFKNAWTIYPIPYPYYSTELGYGVRGRLKLDNFLGLLANVTLGVDVTEVRGGKFGPDVGGGFWVSPIKLLPNLSISGSLMVNHDARVDGANWKINAGAGLHLNLKFLQFAGITMSYNVSNSSGGAFGFTGRQTTHPYFNTTFKHSIGLSRERHSSGGVLRDGYSMTLGNSFIFDSKPENMNSPRDFVLKDIRLDYSLKLSRSYFNMINFKGRIGVGKSFDFVNGQYNPEGYNYDVSTWNRGKRAKAVKGDFIVYLNMDLGILVFSDSKLGDVLLEPFLDITWVNNAAGFSLENASTGSGFELIWIFNSLKFRFTYGVDLQNPGLFTLAITTGFAY